MKKGEDTILFRITAIHHGDDRVEVKLKRRKAEIGRVIFKYDKPAMSRAEISDAIVRFVQDINSRLARAQRAELSRGPTRTDEFLDDEGYVKVRV
jgi:hypothetical protein